MPMVGGTQEDNTGFYDDTEGEPPTGDALELLKQAASVVVGENGEWYLPQGSNVYEKIDDDTGKSLGLVCAGMDRVIGNNDDKSNVVKQEPEDETYGKWFLGPDEYGFYYAAGPDKLLGTQDDVWVRSTSDDDNPLNDLEVVTIELTIIPRVGKELGTDLKAHAGDKLPFEAEDALKIENISATDVTWSVTGTNIATGTTISDGQLTIADDQAVGSTLTVTAQYGEETDTVQITVTNAALGYTDIHSVVPGATTKLSIDGYQWYVLVKDDVNGNGQTEALIWDTDASIKFVGAGYGGSSHGYGSWDLSDSQTILFPNFLKTLDTLSECSVPVTLQSRNAKGEWDTSIDTSFPLTEADLFGTTCEVTTTDSRDYTYSTQEKGQILVLYSEIKRCTTGPHWLRSYGTKAVNSDGTFNPDPTSGKYFRPAMWVTFSQSGT